MHLHVRLPDYCSPALSHASGRAVRIKLASVQPSGSFKLRGTGFACQEHARRGVKSFISSSGGKAGIAVAYAGRELDILVTVVVPETTSPRACRLNLEMDADVLVHSASWQEENGLALSMQGDGVALWLFKRSRHLHLFCRERRD